MEDKNLSNVVFTKGVAMTLWSGKFVRPNPLAPGVLSPFLFKEMELLNSNQRDKSLLLSIFLNAKTDLSKNIDGGPTVAASD